MASWALATFLLYAGVYLVTRSLVPRGGRGWIVIIALPPAVLSLIAGGLSLAAGYAVWLCVSAPSFGVLFGAGLLRAGDGWPRGSATSA